MGDFEITYAREKSWGVKDMTQSTFWNHVCTWEIAPAGDKSMVSLLKSRMHVRNDSSPKIVISSWFWNHVCTWEIIWSEFLKIISFLKSRMHVRNASTGWGRVRHTFEITYAREKLNLAISNPQDTFWNHVCTWEIKRACKHKKLSLLKSRMHVRNAVKLHALDVRHFEITYAREKFFSMFIWYSKLFWNHVCTWEISAPAQPCTTLFLKSRMHVRNSYHFILF